MAQDWEIKRRSDTCTKTGQAFEDGQTFYTLLFLEKGGFRREDLSEEAWSERNDNIQPFSFWRSTFELPPPAEPETLEKATAEDLLRRYMEENDPEKANARYILALMLERKRLLKQIEQQEANGRRLLVYEHVKTGEVFLVPDPELRLDQLAEVQMQIAELLG